VATVLVTGGASGIGLEAVRGFRRRGDSVVIADLSSERAHAAANEVLPGPAVAQVCDIAEPDAPRAVVAAAVEAFGGLDAVFGNAGILKSAPLEEWTAEAWDKTMAVNLRANFLLAQAAAPHLAASELASMIFTSSTGAFRGHAGMAAYGVSKAGLINLARCLADELSPRGIKVNCICPGWVETGFNDPYWNFQADPEAAKVELESHIPLRRQARPEDVARLVLFLASPEAGYITGEAIAVDGGYNAV
jgi:dihydroanticapsin dehydrogenase